MKEIKFKYSALVCLMLVVSGVFAQKPVLSLDAMDKWIRALGGIISNDGNYVSYSIYNQPNESRTVVLKAASGKWKVEQIGIDQPDFTADSRKAIFRKGDSLCLLSLGTTLVERIPNVAGYRLFKHGKREILVIHKTNVEKGKLELHNMATGKVQTYANVSFYTLSEDVNAMVVQRLTKDNNSSAQIVDWVNLITGKSFTIWQGKGNVGNFVLSASDLLAFTVEETEKKNEKSIWYYQSNANQAIQLEVKSADGTTGLKVDGLSNFSKDGSRLFLKLKISDAHTSKQGAAKVDIWSYTDQKLQPQQFKDLEPTMPFYGPGIVQKNYLAVIDINKQEQIQLTNEHEFAENLFNRKTDDWMVIQQNLGGDPREDYWNKSSSASFFLMSTKDGKRHLLDGRISDLSPNGQYALGQNPQTDIYSYELASGIKRNITKLLSPPTGDGGYDMPASLKWYGLSFAGWLSDSKSVIIYDKYDIWQLDPSGTKPPINLTNGYGRKHKIVFRFIENNNTKTLVKNQQLVIIAFNTTTKENGFYQMIFGKDQDPQQLTMGSYVYHLPEIGHGGAPIKAKEANVYLIQRESASESPNYFVTKDFKAFNQLSAVYPERDYNWMTSELINFKTLDGNDEQGALYKPTDFSPNKKYPVIIHYYERKSDWLNIYHVPGTANAEINIPWIVSQGYLVFTPDIHYTIGVPGESALNSVVGAANHLKQLPFVDEKKMGLQGHSFGGFETNYILTHTNIFAAGMAAAGPSDLISFYNFLWEGAGNSKQESLEKGQIRIGATLWERPDLYIKNSPIFKADQITTPLLMMQNKEDGSVPFYQGIEMFTALRRLGKRAWMLQYDGQGHNVTNKKSRIDYTIRMTQFFDHYLKDAPAPQWMLRGIPAKMKGIDDGLALDTTGATPGPGLLIEEKKEPLK